MLKDDCVQGLEEISSGLHFAADHKESQEPETGFRAEFIYEIENEVLRLVFLLLQALDPSAEFLLDSLFVD